VIYDEDLCTLKGGNGALAYVLHTF
jgi:hypothetical protein